MGRAWRWIGGIVVVVAIAAVAVALILREPEPEAATSACRTQAPVKDTSIHAGLIDTPRFGVDMIGPEVGDAQQVLMTVRNAHGDRIRVRAPGTEIFADGGFVKDLDGDRLPEAVADLGDDGTLTQAVLFSKELVALRGDVGYDDLHPLKLTSPREQEQINNMRRVRDCDGDRVPDLVVQTHAEDCDGFSCETGGSVEYTRAYVVSGRDAHPGTISMGSENAPLARTKTEKH